MARRCVKWAYGPTKKRKKARTKRCPYGRVKRGRRKGQCLKGPRGMNAVQKRAWHATLRSIRDEASARAGPLE